MVTHVKILIQNIPVEAKKHRKYIKTKNRIGIGRIGRKCRPTYFNKTMPTQE